MLFNLIEIKAGKETVVMTDSRPKVNNRIKTLRASHRTKKIDYRMEEAEDNKKFQKKLHNPRIGGGDATTPRKVKWGNK